MYCLFKKMGHSCNNFQANNVFSSKSRRRPGFKITTLISQILPLLHSCFFGVRIYAWKPLKWDDDPNNGNWSPVNTVRITTSTTRTSPHPLPQNFFWHPFLQKVSKFNVTILLFFSRQIVWHNKNWTYFLFPFVMFSQVKQPEIWNFKESVSRAISSDIFSRRSIFHKMCFNPQIKFFSIQKYYGGGNFAFVGKLEEMYSEPSASSKKNVIYILENSVIDVSSWGTFRTWERIVDNGRGRPCAGNTNTEG